MSDNPVLYEPPPRTRQSRRQGGRRRIGVVRVCCYMMALVGVGVTTILLYSVVRGAHGFKQTMDFPHFDLVDANVSSKGARVWPLLNATTPFQVRATVWLDVTQHLEQGGTLPKRDDGTPIPVVKYVAEDKVALRSEAILYSEVVAKLNGWQTPTYKDLPLRIPIEPLYSQDLGPSTLRLTTQIEVDDSVADGKFVFASSIFKPTTVLLPRSPTSPRITYGLQDTDDVEAKFSNLFVSHLRAKTINEALEHTGSSTALLSLRRTLTYVNGSMCNATWGGNVHDLTTAGMPTFLDGATVNRRFAASGPLYDYNNRRLYLYGKQCEMMVPHFRAKASVFVLSSLDKPLALAGYAARQNMLRGSSVRSCLSFTSSMIEMTPMLRAKCENIRSEGALETCLVFSTHGTDDDVTATDHEAVAESFAFRYAPVLWSRAMAAADRDHHTIPRVQPRNGKNTSNPFIEAMEANKREPRCELPVLKADSTTQFFDVTLQLRIGSAKAMRLQMTDSLSHDNTQEASPQAEAQLDDDSESRLYGNHMADLLWETANVVAGDRSHPDSKPLVRFFASLTQFVVMCAMLVLTYGYWYTRTTTAGLCMWAQAASAASLAGEVVLSTYRWCKATEGERDAIGDALTIASTLFGFTLQAMVLLRINVVAPANASWRSMRVVRRPLDKAERQCRMAESRAFGWYGAVVIVACMALYDRYARSDQRILRVGHGCYEQDDSAQARMADVALRVLDRSALLGQMLFNIFSPAVHDRRRGEAGKRGSFAGNFKIFFYLYLLNDALQLLVGNVRRIGGHLNRRAPISLMQVEVMLLNCWAAYQAWTLPGVPQRRDDDEEEDGS